MIDIIEISPDTEKQQVLSSLRNASLQKLWNTFLSLQAEIYAEKEKFLIEKKLPFWKEAATVLDLGGGNGDYIAKFSQFFLKKRYDSVEINPKYVEIAQKKHKYPNLNFHSGNINELNPNYINQYDIVICRYVLQHLESIDIAINNIYKYLKPGGRLIIGDSADDYAYISEESGYLSKMFDKINNSLHKMQINRRASLELMSDIQSKRNHASKYFEVEFSNIDCNTVTIDENFIIKTRLEKQLYFLQKLIFFQIWQTQYGLNVDMGKIYDEYKSFFLNEDAYMCDGYHVLVLKKQSNVS